MAAAVVAAVFVQSLLVQWGYDSPQSAGLVIVLTCCLIVFLSGWYIISRLASNFCRVSVKQTLPRQSIIFIPFLLLGGYMHMPYYQEHSLLPYYLGSVAGLLTFIGIFLVHNCWKQRSKDSFRKLFDRKVAISAFFCLAVFVVSCRLHKAYLSKSVIAAETRASINYTSFPVLPAKVPGTFAWTTQVPPSGVFQIAAFPNETFREYGFETPMRYDVRIKTSNGKNHLVAKGKLKHWDASLISYDISGFSGEKVTFELRMREPLSVAGLLGRLHVLFKPSSWATESKFNVSAHLRSGYWSEPIIYKRRVPGEMNVLLIIVDTLRADRLGCYGDESGITPEIDGLAENGVLFKQAISQSPWTLPSIASIYTGRLPTSHRAGMGGVVGNVAMLSPQINFVEQMSDNNYYSVGFVNNSFLSHYFGMEQLFYEYHAYEGSARVGSDLMCQWLEINADKKFFCVLHYFDPHVPRFMIEGYGPPLQESTKADLPPRTKQKDPRYPKDFSLDLAAYASEIAFTDHHIGRVLAKLEEMNLLDKTVIIFTSDHGEEFFDHNDYEHGHTLYDELLHVPLIFHFPPLLPKGRVVETQVRLIDIMPTVLDILDMDFDKEVVSGESLLPLISGESANNRLAVSEFMSRGPDQKSIRFNGYKLIHNLKSGKIELYDLSADPSEYRDMADEKPEIRDDLLDRLKREIEKSALERQGQAEFPELDEETVKALRALGYLD